DEQLKHYKEFGFTGYLIKPITEEKLIKTLNNYLKQNFELSSVTPYEILHPLTFENLFSEKFNLRQIEKAAGGNPVYLKELICAVISQSEEILCQLDEASGKSDYLQISTLAHKLKSSASYLEMENLMQTLTQLESICLENNQKPDDELLQNLISLVFQKLRPVLADINNMIS
ncbi:MAG: Hpt domain-containing protein, partial [Bacteroidota bacterium]